MKKKKKRIHRGKSNSKSRSNFSKRSFRENSDTGSLRTQSGKWKWSKVHVYNWGTAIKRTLPFRPLGLLHLLQAKPGNYDVFIVINSNWFFKKYFIIIEVREFRAITKKAKAFCLVKNISKLLKIPKKIETFATKPIYTG